MRKRKATIERTCRECSATFFEWPFAIAKGQGNYCSLKCSRPNVARMQHTRALARRAIEQPKHDQYRLIPMTGNSRSFKVDLVDFDYMSGFSWQNTKYPGVRHNGKTHGAHRLLMEHILGRKLLASEEVDHENGDKLDNRRSNLRLSTRAENARNVGKTANNTTGYKGVSRCSQTGKWRVTVVLDGVAFRPGRFADKAEAANVYDQWAAQLHGEFARLNFDYN